MCLLQLKMVTTSSYSYPKSMTTHAHSGLWNKYRFCSVLPSQPNSEWGQAVQQRSIRMSLLVVSDTLACTQTVWRRNQSYFKSDGIKGKRLIWKRCLVRLGLEEMREKVTGTTWRLGGRMEPPREQQSV